MQVAWLHGTMITAFDLSVEEFEQVRAQYRQDRSCLRFSNGKQAVPRRGRHVTQHFAHLPNESDGAEPETIYHVMAKKAVRDAALAAGWTAQIEARHPEGGWQADVLVQREDLRIAFEVQWSPQKEDDYVRRTMRYQQDGIETVWLCRRLPKGWYSIEKHVNALQVLDRLADDAEYESELKTIAAAVMRYFHAGRIPEHAPKLARVHCHRCKGEMYTKYLHTAHTDMEPFTPAQLNFLRGHGALWAPAARRISGQSWVWHCPHCEAPCHDWWILREMTQVTVLHGYLIDDSRWESFQRRIQTDIEKRAGYHSEKCQLSDRVCATRLCRAYLQGAT